MKPRFFLSSALVLGAVWSCRAQFAPTPLPTIEPAGDAVFTSTREIRALSPTARGQGVWAATAGGVLGFDGQKWTKWTRRDGLPSHEALEVGENSGQTVARFPLARATFSGAKWQGQSAPLWSKPPLQVKWHGQMVRAALDHLQIGARSFAMPSESGGTHISAVADGGSALLVAIYGDGVWNFDGEKWTRAAAVPPEARETTALGAAGSQVWLGTRRQGIFELQGDKWQPHLQPDEPFAHNIQFFAEFQGVLWASTLDDGLIYRSGATWNHVSTPELSSSAPRQMIEFRNQLYVRHGGGLVDSFDGRSWTRGALASIPRKGVYALAATDKTLFAAGWGGWSEWDGATWTPHFDVPELKGVPLMGLLPDGDHLWIATQSRGLGLYRRGDKTFRWFDERDGLPDDWMTALKRFDGHIYAGTFVGGLARLDGEKWTTFESLKGQNVTALEESGGKLWAATRTGLWEVEGDAATKVGKPWLDSEVQALCAGKTGLWVGARTSLSWVKSKTVEETE